MKGRTELETLLYRAGTACPLCGGKKLKTALLCSRCGRSGRLHIDPAGIREIRKEVFIPRQLGR